MTRSIVSPTKSREPRTAPSRKEVHAALPEHCTPRHKAVHRSLGERILSRDYFIRVRLSGGRIYCSLAYDTDVRAAQKLLDDIISRCRVNKISAT